MRVPLAGVWDESAPASPQLTGDHKRGDYLKPNWQLQRGDKPAPQKECHAGCTNGAGNGEDDECVMLAADMFAERYAAGDVGAGEHP